MSAGGCPVCELLAAGGPQGGIVYEDEHFVATIAHTTPVPGWLILYLRRHELPMTSRLSDGEAAALGPVLRRLVGAIVESAAAVRVYNTLFGEGAQHWHMLLAARVASVPVEDRQVELIRKASNYADLDEAVRVAADIKQALAATRE
jgi:diadenosine tetraphosphate (Ap4A) HIT family hydrolase